MKYMTIPVKTEYFKPNEGYSNLVSAIISCCEDEDIVFISETPVSTVEGNLVDESKYDYGFISYMITELWSKYLWGYILCPLLGYSKRTISNLRHIPIEARYHKEFILNRYGLKHALQPTAEAGVDLSNVPGSYVSLLPENPDKSARIIKDLIYDLSGKNVEVVIIDTDPTYKLRNTYFTTLPYSINGIQNDTGVIGYFLRTFSKKIGATPLASSVNMDLNELINFANLCEDCQKESSDDFFETVYDMQNSFDSDVSGVSVEMLNSKCHIPAVILRFR